MRSHGQDCNLVRDLSSACSCGADEPAMARLARECEASGHGAVVEYESGELKCLRCFSSIPTDTGEEQ